MNLHEYTRTTESEREALPCLCCSSAEPRCEEAPAPPRRRLIQFAAALCIALLGTAWGLARAGELPGDSTYQLALPLIGQDGKPFAYADGRGRPRIVSMFYTSCQYVCPLIIDTMLKTERELAPEQRAALDVLLVSLDPDNDTPEALAKVAAERHLDTSRWSLARADESGVRHLAAVLGVQYKQLADKAFNHSSVLVLLDAEGRIVARSEKLGAGDPEFVAAVKRVVGVR